MAFGYKMLLSILITPLLMIGFGLLFIYKPPKRINPLYGYRTRRSMRNQEFLRSNAQNGKIIK